MSGSDNDTMTGLLSHMFMCQGRGERYDGTNSRTGPLRPKKTEKIGLKDTAKKTNKNKKYA